MHDGEQDLCLEHMRSVISHLGINRQDIEKSKERYDASRDDRATTSELVAEITDKK